METVAKDSLGKAGVKEGDVLLSWNRDNAHGTIESPYDLIFVEIEQLPRGAITPCWPSGDEAYRVGFDTASI